MPKKIEGWSCSVCGTFYETQKEAEECETEHPNLTTVKIAGLSFTNLEGLYGHVRGYKQRIPSSIRVRFSTGHFDFATYKFDYYGVKGN